MQVTTYKRNSDIVVVSLSGRLDTTTSAGVEKQLHDLIEDGENRLIINFKELVYISSAGLRVLIATIKRLQEKQGKLVLSDLNERVYEVLNIAGFTTIFTIKPTESEALTEFA